MPPSGVSLVLAAILSFVGQTYSLDRTYGKWSVDSTTKINQLMAEGGVVGLSAIIVDLRKIGGPPPGIDATNRTTGRLFESGIAAELHFGNHKLGCSHPANVNIDGESCAVSSSTVFSVGRISELFVSTAVLRSASKGHVSLDLPIETYLASRSTDLKVRKLPSVWKFSTALAGRMGSITLRHLLSHTACIRDGAFVALKHTQAGDTSYPFKQYLRDELTRPSNWIPSCTLGDSRESRTYEHSILGVALAAHVLEYADPSTASDIESHLISLLEDLSFENAGFKLSHLTDPGKLAACYGRGVSESKVIQEYPRIKSSVVKAASVVEASNVCVQRLVDLGENVTNGTISIFSKHFEGQEVEANCTSHFHVNTEPSEYLDYGEYGKPAFPGNSLRLRAVDLALFLGMIMNEGNLTKEGKSFLEGSAVEEMFKAHVDVEGGYGGLGWLSSTYDNREFIGLDSGVRNPGVASIVSFSPRSQIGLVLLSNGDMSEGGSSSPMSSTSAHNSLLEIRDYIFDWYEASAATMDSSIASQFSRSGQAQRLSASKAMVLFEVYNITSSSVSFTIYFSFGPGGYHDIPSGKGNNVRLSFEETVMEFFPQNATGKLEGQIPKLVAGSLYEFACDIVDHDDQVLYRKTIKFSTLETGSSEPALGVNLLVLSEKSGTANYTCRFSSLRIQYDMHLHLKYFMIKLNGADVVDINPRHVRLFPAVSSSSLTGQLIDLTPGAEYSFRVDAVDSSHGTQTSSASRTCVVAADVTPAQEQKDVTSTGFLFGQIPINSEYSYPKNPFYQLIYPAYLLGGIDSSGVRGSSVPAASTPTIYSEDLHDSVVFLTEDGVYASSGPEESAPITSFNITERWGLE